MNTANNEEDPNVRKWKCCSKMDDVQVWERINLQDDPKLRQRQFRVGRRATTRITVMITDGKEKEVVEDVYEGGITIWHGAMFALSYFVDMKPQDFAKLKSKRVIEIGCGNGLLGIYAYRYLDAFEVFFQDLNLDVLDDFTRPNLLLNDIDPSSSRVKLIDGPLDSCFEKLPMNTFSLILTSDTVYRTKNFEVLHNCFNYLLDNDPKSEIGKSIYFGNDGGVLAFMEFAKTKGIFTVKVLNTDVISVPHTLIVMTRAPVGKVKATRAADWQFTFTSPAAVIHRFN